jgi:hypothetical protein
MSAHDRAAVRHARRFCLTVSRYYDGCSQHVEFHGLTQSEVKAEKAYQLECWPSHQVSFEVDTSG